MRRLWPAALLLLAAAQLSARSAVPQEESDERVLARAGSAFVTEREYIERFEMLPALYRHRGAALDVTKLEFLYAIVAEKLLAQEAAERALDRDSLFTASHFNVRKLLARDQLYREEVRNRVEVTSRDIAEALVRAPVLLHCGFLFFEREEDARFVRGQLRDAASFDRLVPDTTMAAVRDTATVIWGDADEAVERAAYDLAEDAVSPVVAGGGGWYILRVLSRSARPDFQGLDPAAMRERAEATLRSRREFNRMHEVLREILRDARGFVRTAPLGKLADALRLALPAGGGPAADSMLVLGTAGANRARELCRGILQDTLVVAGGEVWTVEQGIAMLQARRFAVPASVTAAMPRLLNDELEYRAQQEILAQEALRRGLDQRPEVRRRLDLWKEAFLADAMKRHALGHVTLSTADIAAYAAFLDTTAAPPEVNVRELRTRTLEDMQSALAGLDEGRSFADIVRTWTADDALRAAGGETGFFPITARPPIGEIAGGLMVGERFGPVRTGEEFVTFELLDRRDPPASPGTTLPSRDTLETNLRALKQQGLLNRFLARSAATRGIDVYEDRLRQVIVSPLPMMTFRFLGFGGRMFEVPFVDPQTQWLRVPPPAEPVLP